jgi:hypothetical protein
LRRENILVRKIGTTALKIPPSVRVFGLPNVVTEATKAVGFAGRLLMAAAASANAGVSSQAVTTISLGSASNAHTHFDGFKNTAQTFGGIGVEAKGIDTAGEVHTHTLDVRPTYNPKRQPLCCYEGAIEYSPKPGMMWMWSGSIGSLPADHVLCDGTNGTPDMRDRYPEFAADTPGPAAGNNTVTLSGTSSKHGHNHQGGGLGLPSAGNGYGHAYTEEHDHGLSVTAAYTPKYYALAFIMYRPAS